MEDYNFGLKEFQNFSEQLSTRLNNYSKDSCNFPSTVSILLDKMDPENFYPENFDIETCFLICWIAGKKGLPVPTLSNRLDGKVDMLINQHHAKAFASYVKRDIKKEIRENYESRRIRILYWVLVCLLIVVVVTGTTVGLVWLFFV